MYAIIEIHSGEALTDDGRPTGEAPGGEPQLFITEEAAEDWAVFHGLTGPEYVNRPPLSDCVVASLIPMRAHRRNHRGARSQASALGAGRTLRDGPEVTGSPATTRRAYATARSADRAALTAHGVAHRQRGPCRMGNPIHCRNSATSPGLAGGAPTVSSSG